MLVWRHAESLAKHADALEQHYDKMSLLKATANIRVTPKPLSKKHKQVTNMRVEFAYLYESHFELRTGYFD